LSDLTQIVEALNILSSHLDFESIGEASEEEDEWLRDEIYVFLNNRNSRQILFFEILSEHEEINREGLVQEMAERLSRLNYSGRNLAGTLAGIGIRTHSLEKTSLYNKEWREEEDGWNCYYSLTPSYSTIIKAWLEQEE
jgi:hypothetical protein